MSASPTWWAVKPAARLVGLGLGLILVVSGCTPSLSNGSAVAVATMPVSVAEALEDAKASHWQPGDVEFSSAQRIDLTEGSAEISQPGAYILSGGLTDGQVKVEVNGRGLVQLVLDGVDITSRTSAAIDIESADEVVIILASGSVNSLTDAVVYANPEDEPDAALFSRADLSIAGSGKLTVTGQAGDAIASKDGLVIAGGEIQVRAADDAVKGRDYVRLVGGRLQVEAGGDGIKSTNDEDPGTGYVLLEGGEAVIEAAVDCLDAAGDALVTAGSASLQCGDDAIHGERRLVMDGGSVTVSQSYEGLEAPVLLIAGGELDVNASDDALNAAAASDSTSQTGGVDGWPSTEPGGLPTGQPDGWPSTGTGGLPDDSTGQRPGWSWGEPPPSGDDPSAGVTAAPDGSAGRGRPGGGFDGGGFGGGDGFGGGAQEGVHLAITGGKIVLRAGADGIDSNGSGTISGGDLTIYATANGMEGPFDIADGGPTITGGTVVAYGLSGGGGQILTPAEDSAQSWLTMVPASQLPAGQTISLVDKNGSKVANLVPDHAVVLIFYSGPELVEGETYSAAAGSVTTEATAGQAPSGLTGGIGPGGTGPGGTGGGWRQRPSPSASPGSAAEA
ncbi:MAG: carbohydrate-binding domain-containing protein [Bifidobacteriaceae bacterium]|jgi:hypothetical protein|nr:carbohydrate-binding domain-containing protein [Bifidobacteriaceae bacterium]